MTSFLFRNLHADLAGQLLYRFDEREAAVFHEKADRTAVRAATEAMVELLGRADRE